MPFSFQRRDIHLGNWREAPFNRWTLQNVSEFVPTAVIQERQRAEHEAPARSAFADLMLKDESGEPLAAEDHFVQSFADSVVAMRDGAVLAEWHAPSADPTRPHLVFSVSKSITGMLAGIAAGEGRLDPDGPVTDYVPEAEGSAYGSAKVRQLLDMTVSLDFKEDYVDLRGDFDRYRRAMLWNPERPGTTPATAREVLCSLPIDKDAHGVRFHYASPNTDMLGLVIERAVGRRFHEYLAEKLWRPMGARGPAIISVDREGAARAAGGVCVTPHDLARFGQLVLDGGREIIPEPWIADMRENGDRQAWRDGDFSYMLPNGRYRSCWYDAADERGHFFAVGIHAQWIWIDPVTRVAIARTSSRPGADDNAATEIEMSMLDQIARQL